MQRPSKHWICKGGDSCGAGALQVLFSDLAIALHHTRRPNMSNISVWVLSSSTRGCHMDVGPHDPTNITQMKGRIKGSSGQMAT